MIEIVSAELLTFEGLEDVWSCWLEISQGAEVWMLPAGAPGTLTEGELQAHFEAMESYLWGVAQAKQYPVDVFERVRPKQVLKALSLVMLDEVNILRTAAGLPERTAEQLKAAIKAKLRQ